MEDKRRLSAVVFNCVEDNIILQESSLTKAKESISRTNVFFFERTKDGGLCFEISRIDSRR